MLVQARGRDHFRHCPSLFLEQLSSRILHDLLTIFSIDYIDNLRDIAPTSICIVYQLTRFEPNSLQLAHAC